LEIRLQLDGATLTYFYHNLSTTGFLQFKWAP